MARPAIPASWRGAVLAVACLQALLFVLALPQVLFPGELVFAAVTLTSLAAGALLIGGLLRAGGRDALWGGAAIPAALLFGLASGSPLYALVALGACAAVALTLARRDLVPTALATTGLVLGAVSQRLLQGYRGPPGEIPAWVNALGAGGAALLALGLAAYVARAGALPSPTLGRRARLALVAGGVALLAVTWLAGGSLLFFPLWPLVLGLLVVPALARWRAWPAGALLVASVALVGLAPVSTCTFDPWSDAVVEGVPDDADARERIVVLGAVGLHGPQWASGGGFTGMRVECPRYAEGLGGAWALALVGAAAFTAGRRDPRAP